MQNQTLTPEEQLEAILLNIPLDTRIASLCSIIAHYAEQRFNRNPDLEFNAWLVDGYYLLPQFKVKYSTAIRVAGIEKGLAQTFINIWKEQHPEHPL